MDKATWDKLAAAGGIVGVVLLRRGDPLREPARSGRRRAVGRELLRGHRGQLLTSVFLQGLAVLAILWFVAALLCFVVFFAWTLVTSILLTMRAREAPTSSPSAAPAT